MSRKEIKYNICSCLQDVLLTDGCLKSVNLFPDKVLRGVIITMTLRFDMTYKMYKGKPGPHAGLAYSPDNIQKILSSG